MTTIIKLPIGIQDFEDLRRNNYICRQNGISVSFGNTEETIWIDEVQLNIKDINEA
jgi:hypothetical protein